MTVKKMLGQMIGWQPRSHGRHAPLPIHRMDRSTGFSLVELMIVAGLTAVVLAGLGALTLVSDVQGARRSNSIQEAQEQWGRAVTFIQNEVADGATLSNKLSKAYPCNGTVPDPILVLNGPNDPTDPAWTIIYGVRARDVGEEGLYRGPNLLIRCGPLPLAADRNPTNFSLTAKYGNLDQNTSNTLTVLLDRLPNDTPLTVEPLADPAKGLDPAKDLFLDAKLTIRMKAGTEKDGTDIIYPVDQPFKVHILRTP